MLSIGFLVLSLALSAPALAGDVHRREFPNAHARSRLAAREYITPETRLDSYDYIIAGGGLAGLVLADKLSEDGTTTVLVLEAGSATTPEEETVINAPGLTYFQSLLNTEHDYSYKTVPQAGAGDRVMNWPRGKILGGSSAVNGMYLVRPHSKEIDAMHDMIVSDDNQAYADAWKWDSLLEAMKGSETFTPPTAQAAEVAGMRYNEASHGKSGKLHSTYPAYMVPISSAWLPTLEAAGVPISEDAYSGNNVGGFFSLSAINPNNWTRSYSKSAYIDPLGPRANLHILTSAAVTKITFADELQDGERVATGVEFAADANDTPKAVTVAKEVIVAGGAVGSPHMLMVSGVGPREVLEPLNIPVQVDLPGVGEHMQDHLAISVGFNTAEDTQGTIYQSNSDFSKSPEFLSFINSGTAYVNGSFLFENDENFNTFLDGLKSTLADDAALAEFLPGSNGEVNAGYKAIYQTLVDNIYPEAGLVEILYSINAPGRIVVQAAIQTPLSQGRLAISSASIFDAPVLDPKYFSHPGDIVIMRQGLKQVRRLATFSPLRELLGEEASPGPDVSSDADIENWIRSTAGTEFHPGCTCAMLPREQGGVVDASLKVYGTSNVRVIDGSIFPLSMSAHLMAPIYGVAEKAAELILNPPSLASGPASASGSKTSTSKGSSSTGGAANNNVDEDGAARALSGGLVLTTAIAFVSVLFHAL